MPLVLRHGMVAGRASLTPVISRAFHTKTFMGCDKICGD